MRDERDIRQDQERAPDEATLRAAYREAVAESRLSDEGRARILAAMQARLAAQQKARGGAEADAATSVRREGEGEAGTPTKTLRMPQRAPQRSRRAPMGWIVGAAAALILTVAGLSIFFPRMGSGAPARMRVDNEHAIEPRQAEQPAAPEVGDEEATRQTRAHAGQSEDGDQGIARPPSVAVADDESAADSNATKYAPEQAPEPVAVDVEGREALLNWAAGLRFIPEARTTGRTLEQQHPTGPWTPSTSESTEEDYVDAQSQYRRLVESYQFEAIDEAAWQRGEIRLLLSWREQTLADAERAAGLPAPRLEAIAGISMNVGGAHHAIEPNADDAGPGWTLSWQQTPDPDAPSPLALDPSGQLEQPLTLDLPLLLNLDLGSNASFLEGQGRMRAAGALLTLELIIDGQPYYLSLPLPHP